MLEDVHHQDGAQQAQHVSAECRAEVELGATLEALVEAEQQRNEDARYYDVAQSQHREVRRAQAVDQQVLREHHCETTTKFNDIAGDSNTGAVKAGSKYKYFFFT